MKFSVPASLLANALATATRALSARTPNPILEGVLVTAGDNCVRLTCSDGNTTIIARADATILEPGSAVAPGRLFTDLVKRSGGGILTVAVDEKDMFRITCSGSRTNISGQSAELFPEPPADQHTKKATMTHSMLREMLDKALPAVASADLREVLTGAYFETRGGNVTLVGLDGVRLVRVTSICSAIPDEVSAIIPGKAAAELLRMLRHDDAPCTLQFGPNSLYAALGDAEIHTRLIAGQYIDYRKIIPTSFGTRAIAQTEELRAAVARASIAADNGDHILRMRIEGNALFVEAASEVASCTEAVCVTKEGDDLKIAFNVKYIIDALKAIETAEVELRFNASTQPCVIAPTEQNDFIILVLPVRTAQ
jgi:DNA polymerase-3 subunit beta